MPPRDRRRYACNFLAPNLLIDFNEHTPGALEEFGIDPTSIACLLISHGHYDHFQPLEIIRFAASLPHPLKVFGSNMVIDALELCRDTVFDGESGRFVTRQGPYNLETVRLAPGDGIEAGGVRFTSVHSNHSMNKRYCIMEEQTLNFLIDTGGKRIFYGLDSSYMMPQALTLVSGTHLDLAILDATFGPREIDPAVSGHHNWAMLDETLSELRAAGCVDDRTVLVADHLSTASIGPHDEVAAQQATKGITLAYDGLTIPL